MMYFHWIMFLAMEMYHFDQMMINGTKDICFEYMMIKSTERFTFNESHGNDRNISLWSNNVKCTYTYNVHRITYFQIIKFDVTHKYHFNQIMINVILWLCFEHMMIKSMVVYTINESYWALQKYTTSIK